MKKLDKFLEQVYSLKSGMKGIDYLHSIISLFGNIIKKDHILISRVNNLNEAKTFVFYSGGKFQDDMTYSLIGSPCNNVFKGSLCIIHPNNVQQLFPKDDRMSGMNINSYIGNPLLSRDGILLGIIAILDQNPLSDTESGEMKILTQVISVMVSHILEEEVSIKEMAPNPEYDNYFEKGPAAIFLLDKLHNFTFKECNSYALKMFECEKDHIIGKTPADFSPPVQPDGSLSSEKALQYLNSAIEGELKSFEWVHKTKSGKEFFTEVTLSKIEIGSYPYIQAIVQDITEKKQSNLLTQQERDFSYMLIDNLPAKFSLIDITDGILNAKLVRSNKYWQSLGYSKDELQNQNPLKFYMPGDSESLKKIWDDLKQNKANDFELTFHHKGGYDIQFFYRASIFEKDNKLYLMGFGIDISEQKQAEKALQISEQKFKNIFNSISDGIIVMDLENRILNANQTLINMFGYKFEDVVFQNVLRYVPEHYHKQLKSRFEQLLRNEHQLPFEMEINKQNGEAVNVEISSIVTRYGESEGIITIVRDISERKLYDKKIFNSEIYAEEKERERLARELHDGLGPILSTCKIYLYSLCEKMEGDKDMLNISTRSLRLLDDALGTIKEVSNNLSPHILHNFGFVQALFSFTTYLESISKTKFDINYDFEKRLNEVFEITVYRILTELINNTIKYAEASLVTIDIELNEPLLKVRYTDNGKGFDLEEIKKQNRGFGIINTENRVNKLNGKFSYSTSPGKGVVVEFILNIL